MTSRHVLKMIHEDGIDERIFHTGINHVGKTTLLFLFFIYLQNPETGVKKYKYCILPIKKLVTDNAKEIRHQ
jgi:hypothetical protein